MGFDAVTLFETRLESMVYRLFERVVASIDDVRDVSFSISFGCFSWILSSFLPFLH